MICHATEIVSSVQKTWCDVDLETVDIDWMEDGGTAGAIIATWTANTQTEAWLTVGVATSRWGLSKWRSDYETYMTHVRPYKEGHDDINVVVVVVAVWSSHNNTRNIEACEAITELTSQCWRVTLLNDVNSRWKRRLGVQRV